MRTIIGWGRSTISSTTRRSHLTATRSRTIARAPRPPQPSLTAASSQRGLARSAKRRCPVVAVQGGTGSIARTRADKRPTGSDAPAVESDRWLRIVTRGRHVQPLAIASTPFGSIATCSVVAGTQRPVESPPVAPSPGCPSTRPRGSGTCALSRPTKRGNTTTCRRCQQLTGALVAEPILVIAASTNEASRAIPGGP